MAEDNVPESATEIRSVDHRLGARFCLHRSLGAGGMGEVYLAEDSKLHRLVAIKTIRPELCKEIEIRKRIERECLLHAKVGAHPHIVTLFDRIEDGDQINLVMEYVDGETLQSMLERHGKEGTVPPLGEALITAAQCLEALSRIHAHGIVHRDIKPANIILSRDDSGGVCAKLMDFGIARMQMDDEFASRLTNQYGSGPGTPLYMAPEQIDPQTFGAVSPATDVYAMGIMLYQMTSGEPPFSGTLSQIFNGHLHSTPPSLRARVKGRVPDALVEIVECALAKQPGERFPTAKAFRQELLRVAATEPVDAAASACGVTLPAGIEPRPAGAAIDPSRTITASEAQMTAAAAAPGSTMLAGAAVRGAEVRRKRKLVQVAVAVAAVLLLAVAGVVAYRMMGPSEEPQTAEGQPTTPAVEQETAPVASTPGPSAPAEAVPQPVATPPATDTATAPDVVPPAAIPTEPMQVVTEASVLPAPNFDEPAAPVSTGGSAMNAFEEALASKQQEPAASADVAAVVEPVAAEPEPEPVVAEPEPAKPAAPKAVAPKPKPRTAAQRVEQPRASQPAARPEPKPAPEPPKKASSGGWDDVTVSTGTHKKN